MSSIDKIKELVRESSQFKELNLIEQKEVLGILTKSPLNYQKLINTFNIFDVLLLNHDKVDIEDIITLLNNNFEIYLNEFGKYEFDLVISFLIKNNYILTNSQKSVLELNINKLSYVTKEMVFNLDDKVLLKERMENNFVRAFKIEDISKEIMSKEVNKKI